MCGLGTSSMTNPAFELRIVRVDPVVLAALRMRGRWNHNSHYHRVVLREIRPGATRALDVGCGEGALLEDLVLKVPTVVGIDADPTILRQAAQAAPTATIINGDFLTHSFEPESFDLVAAVASTHHMDLHTALLRASELVRPGGAVVVIGIAQPATVKDYLVESAGLLCSRLLRLVVGYREVCAPTVWPPPLTYAECRDIGVEALPGAQFRRRLFFRYSLVWTKP